MSRSRSLRGLIPVRRAADSPGIAGVLSSRWRRRRLGGPGGGAREAPGCLGQDSLHPPSILSRPPGPARGLATRLGPARAGVSDQARCGQSLPGSLAAASRGPPGASKQDGGGGVCEARAAATAAPVRGPGARAAPGRGLAAGRTMLRSTGFFRAIDCPYWSGAPGGPCRRPYCHFRHRGARGPGAPGGGGAAPPAAGNARPLARPGLGFPARAWTPPPGPSRGPGPGSAPSPHARGQRRPSRSRDLPPRRPGQVAVPLSAPVSTSVKRKQEDVLSWRCREGGVGRGRPRAGRGGERG